MQQHIVAAIQVNPLPASQSVYLPAGLFDNVLSDYLWARAVLLTGKPWGLLISNCSNDGAAGFPLCCCSCLTASLCFAGPTIATVGLSIQIPLAVLAEGSFQQPGWLHNHGSAALMILGALAVILGFLGVTVGTASLEMPHVLPVEDGEMSSPDTVVV